MTTDKTRASALQSVGYNTGLLPGDAIECDLLSDSWLHQNTAAVPGETGTNDIRPLTDVLAEHYPYAHCFPVSRGRYAEGVFGSALAVRGKTVLTNAPFPTTAFHLESAGATLKCISVPEAQQAFDPFPFKGNIDLAALATSFTSENVGAVFVECCVNALGGHPISLENLKEAHSISASHNVPLYLDSTRLMTNAILIQQREQGLADRSLAEIAVELYRASDGCTASLAKDLVCPVGGIIAVNDDALGARLGDLVHIMWGDGLSAADKNEISRILSASALNETRVIDRAKLARDLYAALTAAEVPVVQPWGGHGVYVDAGTFFPHLSDEHYPAETLAAELFLESGLRTVPNMCGMSPSASLKHLIRLALPLCSGLESQVNAIADAFRAVAQRREQVRGLTVTSEPPGIMGDYLKRFAPR